MFGVHYLEIGWLFKLSVTTLVIKCQIYMLENIELMETVQEITTE